MDYIGKMVANRLGGINFGKEAQSYKFAVIKEAKARARIINPDIALIDMGVGEPDMPAIIEIADVLYNESKKAENRFYSDNGIQEFSESATQYLKNVYGVNNINSITEILHGIGSKSILAMLPSCFINPGDITLVTIPGYPVIATWTNYLGGSVYKLPLLKENEFYPDLTSIPEDILKRAKLLYINYPNNPTGQIATVDFYKQVIDFAYMHKIIVVSDAAYASLTFDGEKPLSFLSIDGAKDVGVEIHSLSKAFNMTGWRMAFVAGNSKVISAYGAIKDNTDSGQFRAIQKAGIYAMNHPNITREICAKYSRRLDLLVNALNELGFEAKKPKGSFYCYVKCPKLAGDNVVFNSAEEVAKYFIEKAAVSVVPWDDAGAYLRFSVTFEAETENDEKDLIAELKKRLVNLKLVF